MKLRSHLKRRDGCGFLVLTCLFSCLFLVLNSVMVVRMYPVLAALGPGVLRHRGVEQMMMFVGPVLLIFVEWWLVDTIVDGLGYVGLRRTGRGPTSPRRPDIR